MDIQSMVSCGAIVVGAVILVASAVIASRLRKTLPFIRRTQRPYVSRMLRLNLLLKVFFIVGYLVVFLAFVLGIPWMSESVVGAMFLLASVFIFAGVFVQANILDELQHTLGGLLPICSRCKRVHDPLSDGEDQRSWETMEDYVAKRSEVEFTHGLCPHCMRETLDELNEDRAHRRHPDGAGTDDKA